MIRVMIRGLTRSLCLLLTIGVSITCTPREKDSEQIAVEGAAPFLVANGELIPNPSPPPGAKREFSTDFSRSLIDFSEVISGGPSKDGIPAINAPQFESIAAADRWVGEHETVFVIDGTPYGEKTVRIYPVQIFIYHEIVNDRLGSTPISITYCPLCNSALAFDGRVNGHTLTFGVSGRLRFSNMIMYDDKTESWWQQATGKGIVGELAGARLTILPLLTVSWSEAKARYTDAEVLSRITGYNRPYGRNPYRGYDTSARPFLFLQRAIDTQQEPFERVVVGRVGGEGEPFLYSVLQRDVVIQDSIGGVEVVLFWATDAASPLDSGSTADGRIVGSANIFAARLDSDDDPLTFVVKRGRIIDQQTNSEWSPLGVALSGPLAGRQLTALPSIQHFWFSYAAFAEES